MKKYEKALERLRKSFFLAPDGKNVDTLINLVRLAVETVTVHQGKGPLYPFSSRPRSISQVALEAKIPLVAYSENQEAIIETLFEKIQGSVKSSNPFMVKNIIPTPAFIHLAINLAVSLNMPNGVTGEDAGETLNAEIACASAIAKLAGLDVKKAAGGFYFWWNWHESLCP